MSFYLSIVALQRPFPYGIDEPGRVLYSFDVVAQARAPVGDWERELVKLLSDAGAGTYGTDTFIGLLASIPAGAGPYTLVLETAGVAADETHDGARYENLSAQVIVRAKTRSVAATRALAAWRALDGKHNVTVTV